MIDGRYVKPLYCIFFTDEGTFYFLACMSATSVRAKGNVLGLNIIFNILNITKKNNLV